MRHKGWELQIDGPNASLKNLRTGSQAQLFLNGCFTYASGAQIPRRIYSWANRKLREASGLSA